MCKYRNLLSNCQFFANFSEEILSQIAFFCTIIRLRIKKQAFCVFRTFLLNNLAFFKVFV